MQGKNYLSTIEQAQEMGLLKDEFNKIIEILGRTPNFYDLPFL